MRTVTLGPVTLYTWGLLVGIGILIATTLAAFRARRYEVPWHRTWSLAFAVIAYGLVGARALYVAEYWREFWADPWRVLAIWEGGLSAWGGILLGLYGGWRFVRQHDLNVRQVAAAVAPPLLLGDAIGRLGGAASHMYAGAPTTSFLSYTLRGVQRHEVGSELALASALGFLLALVLERLPRRAGQSFPVAPFVLFWYSLERLVLDGLRATDLPNADLRYAGFTLAQYFAGASLLVALLLWRKWQRV